jgi:hypothetical protein
VFESVNEELQNSQNEYHKFRGKMTYGDAKPKKGDYVKAPNGEIGKINKIRRTIVWVKFASNKKSFLPTDIKDLKPTGKKEKGKTLWTESVNEGFTKYHIRLTDTPGWYGVWDKKGKQKFEGIKDFS